jgi:hypothetical protein
VPATEINSPIYKTKYWTALRQSFCVFNNKPAISSFYSIKKKVENDIIIYILRHIMIEMIEKTAGRGLESAKINPYFNYSIYFSGH